MSQERITTLLNENRSYLPPEHGKTSAYGLRSGRVECTMQPALGKTGIRFGDHEHRPTYKDYH